MWDLGISAQQSRTACCVCLFSDHVSCDHDCCVERAQDESHCRILPCFLPCSASEESATGIVLFCRRGGVCNLVESLAFIFRLLQIYQAESPKPSRITEPKSREAVKIGAPLVGLCWALLAPRPQKIMPPCFNLSSM